MTIAGIITMLLSIGIVWGLFIVCCTKLVKSDKEANDSNEEA
jgi:hypothetical protein